MQLLTLNPATISRTPPQTLDPSSSSSSSRLLSSAQVSVLRPESMDEMEQQIMLEMSEKLEGQKQSTEAGPITGEADPITEKSGDETIMPRFFSQTSIPPRPPSQPPDPPDFYKSNLKFDSTLLSAWVIRCEQFFMKNNTLPEQKVRIVSLHMEGEAFH